MQNYFENIFSKYQCGFRKGYNAQHCFIALIEKWKQSVDKLVKDIASSFPCCPVNREYSREKTQVELKQQKWSE